MMKIVAYFLEVNKDYPKHLCSSHKDLPFLPERKKIRENRKTCL